MTAAPAIYFGPELTTQDIADALGVSYRTVNRWANEWHGGVGTGVYRSLTTVDLLVARAWYVIDGDPPRRGASATVRRQRLLAENVIRRCPRRWLLLTPTHAETCDEAETAAVMWLDSQQPAGQLIDLWSTPGDTHDR